MGRYVYHLDYFRNFLLALLYSNPSLCPLISLSYFFNAFQSKLKTLPQGRLSNARFSHFTGEKTEAGECDGLKVIWLVIDGSGISMQLITSLGL